MEILDHQELTEALFMPLKIMKIGGLIERYTYNLVYLHDSIGFVAAEIRDVHNIQYM